MNPDRSALATENNPGGLTRKALDGAAASVAGRIIGLAAGFTSLSILARLLTPGDYGVFSIVILISGLAVLVPQAVGNAITRESALDERHISGVFTVVLISSLILAALLYFGFDGVVGLYPSFQLGPYSGALCALIPLSSVTAFFDTVQARQLRFRTIAVIELVFSNILQAVISIILAYAGWGAWALIIGYGSATFAKLVAQLATGMLRVARFGSGHQRIYRSSAWFLLIGVVNYAGRNGDNAIVGYLLGPAALGIYGRAFNLMMRPVTTFGGTINSVFYPVLASLGHDPVRVRAGYLKALNLTALLCLPLSGFAVIYGNEIILLLFGEKWTDVAAPFKILVGALYFRLSYRVTESVAFSKDALAGTALRQTIYGIAVIVGSIVGSRWGVTGIATGVTIALGIFFVLSATFANRLSQTSLKQFARAHASAVFITLVVVISLATLKSFVLTRFGVVSSLLAAMIAFMTICSALVLCGPSFLFRESVLDPMRSSLKMWLRPRVRRRL